jgi:glycosyltransferase involved in cell wall biosynthesis
MGTHRIPALSGGAQSGISPIAVSVPSRTIPAVGDAGTEPISVVMAARNAERTIRSAACSILEQRYPAFELVIVDDASTDRTRAIVESLSAADGAAHISLLRCDTRVGRSAARNQAIAVAQHDLIAIMDADDFALPSRLARSASMLTSIPEVSGVGGQLVAMHAEQLLTLAPAPTEPTEIHAQLLDARMALMHPTVLARREVFQHGGGYREDMSWCEDLELFSRAAHQFAFAASSDIWLLYRRPRRLPMRYAVPTERYRARIRFPGSAASDVVRRGADTVRGVGRTWWRERRHPLDRLDEPASVEIAAALAHCRELDAIDAADPAAPGAAGS